VVVRVYMAGLNCFKSWWNKHHLPPLPSPSTHTHTSVRAMLCAALTHTGALLAGWLALVWVEGVMGLWGVVVWATSTCLLVQVAAASCLHLSWLTLPLHTQGVPGGPSPSPHRPPPPRAHREEDPLLLPSTPSPATQQALVGALAAAVASPLPYSVPVLAALWLSWVRVAGWAPVTGAPPALWDDMSPYVLLVGHLVVAGVLAGGPTPTPDAGGGGGGALVGQGGGRDRARARGEGREGREGREGEAGDDGKHALQGRRSQDAGVVAGACVPCSPSPVPLCLLTPPYALCPIPSSGVPVCVCLCP
jgi:hypothetical protein